MEMGSSYLVGLGESVRYDVKVLANYDDKGRLEKLHLNPVEECQADDMKHRKELTWRQAFAAFFFAEGDLDSNPDGLMCKHCDFKE